MFIYKTLLAKTTSLYFNWVNVHVIYLRTSWSQNRNLNFTISVQFHVCKYIDDLLPINNLQFENYQVQMYRVEFEIKHT